MKNKLVTKTILGFQALMLTLGLSSLPNNIQQINKYEKDQQQITLNRNRVIKRNENLKKRLKKTDCPKERKVLLKYGTMNHKEVIKEIDTVEKASEYGKYYLEYKLDHEVFGKDEYWASFAETHSNMADDCDGYSMAFAALLSDNGYEPYIFVTNNKNKESVHTTFVYKKDGLYGYIEQNHYQKPKYPNLEELARAMGFDGYKSLIHVSKKYSDWIDNDKNMKDLIKGKIKEVKPNMSLINKKNENY